MNNLLCWFWIFFNIELVYNHIYLILGKFELSQFGWFIWNILLLYLDKGKINICYEFISADGMAFRT